MLNAPTRLSHPVLGIRPEVVRGPPQLAFHELFIGTRRQIAIIATAIIAASALGLIYLAVVSPRYSAVAELLTDTQRSRSHLDAPSSTVDSSVIASQIETLKSETIARTVISKLGLDSDREFTEPNLISRMAAWFDGTTAAAESQRGRQQRVVDRFRRALDVFVAGRSYAAVVRFTSVDPEKAARITNAICEAYIDDQLDTKFLNSTKTNLWFERRLNELKAQLDSTNQAIGDFRRDNPGQLDGQRQGQLRSLLAAAQAQQRAYDTFQSLGRYSQTIDQQALPATEARVVTWAEPPLSRSSPPIGLTLLFSIMAGSGLGMIVAYASEHLSRTVRTRRHVERDLNVRCLGFLPLLKRRKRWNWRRFRLGGPRKIKGDMLLNTHESPCASESLIGVRVALDACNRSSTGISVGITSPRLGEGKTTLAFNLARCIADGGKRVLLIDADLRSLSLTRGLAPQTKRGLSEALRGTFALTDIDVVPGLGFRTLLQPLDHIPRRPPDVLSSRQMRELLDGAKSIFDYVVLDLPPVIDHADVCASANQLDLFVLVAEWGRTKIIDLEEVWARCDHIAERLAGIVINKVPRDAECR